MVYKYINCINCQLNNNLIICSDCCKHICFNCINISYHYFCIKCLKNITCYNNQKCYDCRIEHYNMIDEFIAVGDCDSLYNDFDIIINLFIEENNCNLNDIIIKEENNKIIYNIGLIDDPTLKDNTLYLLTSIIPKIINNENKKILFHCFAGVSRSSTFAIAYLMVKYKLNVNEALNMVKSKRQMIQPNYGFIEALNDFYNLIRTK